MKNQRGNAILIILGIIGFTSILLYSMLPMLNRGQQTSLLIAYQADADNAFDLLSALVMTPTSCNKALGGLPLVPIAPAPISNTARHSAPWSTIAGTPVTFLDNWGHPALAPLQVYNGRLKINNIQLYDLGAVVSRLATPNVYHYAAITMTMSNVTGQPFTITKTVYNYVISDTGATVSTCDVSAMSSSMASAFSYDVAAPNVTGSMIAVFSGAAAYFSLVPIGTGSFELYTGAQAMGDGGGTITASGCVPDYLNGTTLSGLGFGFQGLTSAPVSFNQTISGTAPYNYPSNCVTGVTGPLAWNETGYQAPFYIE